MDAKTKHRARARRHVRVRTKVSGNAERPRQVTLPTRLVVRQSCGPVPS